MIVPDLNKVLIIVSTEDEPKTRPQETQCPFWTSGCDHKKRGGKWAFPTENKAQTCLRVPTLKQSNGVLPSLGTRLSHFLTRGARCSTAFDSAA